MVFAWLSLNLFLDAAGKWFLEVFLSLCSSFYHKKQVLFFNVGAPEGPNVMAKLVFSLVFIFRDFSGVSRSFNDQTYVDDEILKCLSILHQRI